MSIIKTAISIEESIFNDVQNLAKDRKVSRSEIFRTAAAEYIERQKNEKILRQLNDVYAIPRSDDERKFHDVAIAKTAQVIDQW